MKWPWWILFLLTLFENCLAPVVLPISVYHLLFVSLKLSTQKKGYTLCFFFLFWKKKSLYENCHALFYYIYILSVYSSKAVYREKCPSAILFFLLISEKCFKLSYHLSVYMRTAVYIENWPYSYSFSFSIWKLSCSGYCLSFHSLNRKGLSYITLWDKTHRIWPIWKRILIRFSNLTEFSDHLKTHFIKK